MAADVKGVGVDVGVEFLQKIGGGDVSVFLNRHRFGFGLDFLGEGVHSLVGRIPVWGTKGKPKRNWCVKDNTRKV